MSFLSMEQRFGFWFCFVLLGPSLVLFCFGCAQLGFGFNFALAWIPYPKGKLGADIILRIFGVLFGENSHFMNREGSEKHASCSTSSMCSFPLVL